MIFDFHAHPTFKPFNSKSIYDDSSTPPPGKELWKERFRPRGNTSKIPAWLEKEVNYTSQIHLNSLAEGGVRGVCVSLYPLEQVFTIGFKDYKKSWAYKILNIIPPLVPLLIRVLQPGAQNEFFKMVATLTGFDASVIKEIHSGNYNYYSQLKKEYQYLVDHQLKQPDHGDISYEIANNYAEYKSILDRDRIAFVLSVEGMNAFLDESTRFNQHVADEKAGNTQQIRQLYTDNVTEFKTQHYPPFIATFAHHQYNFLSGHAPSFVGIAGAAFNQEGEYVEGNNEPIEYFRLGINALGLDMIKLLLDRNIGRRVLIDTKHLSAQARYEYHQFVKDMKNIHGDPIPIVQTHTGVNGRPSFKIDKNDDLELKKKEMKKSEFFTISINLFDDEIVDIVDSDGLIGIMLDEKRIMGEQLPAHSRILAQELDVQPTSTRGRAALAAMPENRFKYNKRRFKQNLSKLVKYRYELELEKMKEPKDWIEIKRLKGHINDYQGKVGYLQLKMRHIFLSIFMNQVLYIVKKVEELGPPSLRNGKAWDHVCIGSDYEGVINPLDIFYYASDLADLENQLTIFWHKAIKLSERYPEFKMYKDYLFGKQPSYYVKKILWDNSEDFLKKYFTDEYLKQGAVPPVA